LAWGNHDFITEPSASGEAGANRIHPLAEPPPRGAQRRPPIENCAFGMTSPAGPSKARQNGMAVQGAGDTDAEVIFPASDPRFNLPAIYFFLGQQVMRSVQ
jgi:hypothetical protein